MPTRRIVTLLAATCAVLSIGLPARAYETLKASSNTTGETRWSKADMPIPYMINQTGSADVAGDSEFTAITKAMDTWGAPTCADLTTRYDGKTPDVVSMGDGKNWLDWVENSADWPPEAGAQAIAFTTPLFFATGQFYEADIRFNGVNYKWTTGGASWSTMDVETIALHELGHFFGLADLYDNTSCYYKDVVMCGTNNGETKRALKQDDIDGICYLYPVGKNNICATDADCSAQVCSVTMTLGGEVSFVCMDPVGAADPGDRCGDLNNTPLNPGDDVLCKNLLCMDSMLCTKPCASTSECPYNMTCGPVSVDLDDQGHVANFQGCAGPGGCLRNSQCSGGKVCGLYRVGDGLTKTCVDPLGPGADGDACSVWSDCRSGACLSGRCASVCDDNFACPPGGSFKCENGTVTGEDGKSIDAKFCKYVPPVQDAGFDSGEDTGFDSGYDAGFDAGYDAGFDAGHDTGADTGHDTGNKPDSGPDVGPVDAGHDTGANPDSGPDVGPVGTDTGVEPGRDTGAAPRNDADGPAPEETCDCDLTYDCDPDCDCDPECAAGAEGPAAAGCACSSVGF